MKLNNTLYGKMADGRQVRHFSLENENGLSLGITNYGGIITSIMAPGRNGIPEEITAGFPDLDSYLGVHPHFGVIVGRYANRIAHGRFSIDGHLYQLEINNPPNHLHGGNQGFHSKLWDYTTRVEQDFISVELSYLSPHMEEGYPGNLECRVTYKLYHNNELLITYQATTDKPTHVNLTNHPYFNLGSFKETVFSHQLKLNASQYLQTDEHLIPTGDLITCRGTSFDYKNLTLLRHEMDHCFVLKNSAEVPDAVLYEPQSGRMLSMFCTQPGLQVYTANFLDGSIKGHNGVSYQKNQAICLESQHFPDSPNHASFPSTLLRPGQVYRHSTKYVFSAE